jgi:hypothetical protein
MRSTVGSSPARVDHSRPKTETGAAPAFVSVTVDVNAPLAVRVHDSSTRTGALAASLHVGVVGDPVATRRRSATVPPHAPLPTSRTLTDGSLAWSTRHGALDGELFDEHPAALAHAANAMRRNRFTLAS